MKRIIYSVGFFLIVLFLCTGFMLSYQVADLKDRIYDLEESSAQVQQQVSAVSANPKGQDFIFQRYEEGILKQECYRITAYGEQRVILRRENTETVSENAKEGYQLRLENGCVVVYEKAYNTVFEYTDIPLEALPKDLQAEVLLGKDLKTLDELYSFLENYSS